MIFLINLGGISMDEKNYEQKLLQLPLKATYEKEDLMTEDFLHSKDNKIEIYWAPFDYINKEAKVIILGITPGWTQMELAFNYVRHHIHEENHEQMLCNAKKQASFGGTVMRRNLIEMLDGIELNKFLKIDSCNELFSEKHSLLHTTSVLRYPVFIEKENYTGSNPKLLSNKLFLKMIEELLVPELNSIENAVIIPAGKAVSDVLEYLVNQNKISHQTILFHFPHPSGANANRIKQYESNKDYFKEQLHKITFEGRDGINENLNSVFLKNNFKITKETSKATEFENQDSQEIVYLLPNNEITIVLNPKTVEGNLELEERCHGMYHNTALMQFPKRKNNGKDPIHYGYSFKFQSIAELDSFFKSVNLLYKG